MGLSSNPHLCSQLPIGKKVARRDEDRIERLRVRGLGHSPQSTTSIEGKGDSTGVASQHDRQMEEIERNLRLCIFDSDCANIANTRIQMMRPCA